MDVCMWVGSVSGEMVFLEAELAHKILVHQNILILKKG